MKIFQCGHCNASVFFENNSCDTCGHLTGYRATDHKMLTFAPDIAALISDREHTEYKYCKNKEYNVCNWVLEKHDPEDYCSACQLNRTIPNLSNTASDNFENWQHLEIAKHRLVYQLQKIGLPLRSKLQDEDGLCFDFVSKKDNPSLMTGHANGVVTILIREGNSVLREQARKDMVEPYRTLVGHLRHEVGHYYWERLVRHHPKVLKDFRAIFGNEETDYSEALQTYYKTGAPKDWQDSYISEYATSHPWEDWAETWAHYLHIMEMVETAYFFRVNVNPKFKTRALKTKVSFDPYTKKNFDAILHKCVPLSLAVNSINRAMGIPDVYPFVISPPIIEKLKFIHQLLLYKRK
ncbi:zinc-binding metallopeptidase family protein [Winogradskyella psychrotolerans]|uniref:zinc-binding metallopeptidase family protein n=1 Tax=Winogradskyella psychrotolerans TaxID=1344585 RepID=UPI001C07D8AF|nr:putative zinc-binding metallopeptidase [Winogradskyella psychrotolerans]MBU2929315.1 putative zinc-binding peptidase [Winogradskyella psychrotolerans]